MANVVRKVCGHASCNKTPSYGMEGSKTAEFCVGHAKEGMVNVVERRCSHTKRRSYGVEGSETAGVLLWARDRRYGERRKQEELWPPQLYQIPDVGCGVEGSKRAEFCVEHKKEGMVNVKNNKKCGHPNCTKYPSYGVEGSETAEFCAEHKKEGMVNVKKRCVHPNCTKYPSYGVEGSKTAEFCAEHKKEGMVNVVSKRCGHPGCNKVASFGLEDNKTAEFCARHKREGVLYLVNRNKRCSHPGCTKQPPYGVAGSKRVEFCHEHANEGIANEPPDFLCGDKLTGGGRGGRCGGSAVSRLRAVMEWVENVAITRASLLKRSPPPESSASKLARPPLQEKSWLWSRVLLWMLGAKRALPTKAHRRSEPLPP